MVKEARESSRLRRYCLMYPIECDRSTSAAVASPISTEQTCLFFCEALSCRSGSGNVYLSRRCWIVSRLPPDAHGLLSESLWANAPTRSKNNMLLGPEYHCLCSVLLRFFASLCRALAIRCTSSPRQMRGLVENAKC